MKLMIGIEASSFITDIPGFLPIFISATNPHHIHETLYVYEYGEKAEEAADFLREAELLQDIHSLLKIDQGIRGEDFFDYGFSAGSIAYLYKDYLSAFKINGESDIQTEMALLQLEEHLTFTSISGNKQRIYFANSQFDELIKGIVKAYRVEVEFLDLDK